jgi:hypothetical protein
MHSARAARPDFFRLGNDWRGSLGFCFCFFYLGSAAFVFKPKVNEANADQQQNPFQHN